MVVDPGSPHVVRGTHRRDVIVIRDPGHVVGAGAGADLVCGSDRGEDDGTHDRVS
jgi:hypothetical protein